MEYRHYSNCLEGASRCGDAYEDMMKDNNAHKNVNISHKNKGREPKKQKLNRLWKIQTNKSDWIKKNDK